MPSRAHEIPVVRLTRDPSLLSSLAEKLGKPPPVELRPVDSTVRFADAAEVRPDLILARGKRGAWDAIEVQLRVDPCKPRRWAMLVSALNDQRRHMGDLWVLTASRRTAAWAEEACNATGRGGTELRVKPVVLLLGPREVEALLDEGCPSLAFFAAWAVRRRRGPRAEQVVKRAMEVTDLLPAKALRWQQRTDIMGVLDGRLAEKLKERVMQAKRSTEPRWVREMRHEMFADQAAEMEARGEARGKAEGKRDALLVILEGRGLSITRAQRAEILGCVDLPTLDRWIAGAVNAASVRELFAAPAPKKNGARNGSTKHRAARAA